jgi:hypothetical protein
VTPILPTVLSVAGAIIASGLTALAMVRVANKQSAKDTPSTASDHATTMASTTLRFERLIERYEQENLHLVERLVIIEGKVAVLEQINLGLREDKHRQNNLIMALRKREGMHSDDRVRRSLPPLPWPRGTKIEDVMGLSDLAGYDLDDAMANRGPRDNKPLGSDAFDTDSLRGLGKKDDEP